MEAKTGKESNKGKTTVVSAQLEKQIENKKKKRRTKPKRGVLFLKNIPHGFYEEQMKNYFNQFGKVTRIRLVRSKRTGNKKGFAYVEFQYPEVAQEALKSVENRLMFNKIVKVAYIPPEEQKFDFFRTGLRAVRNAIGKLNYVSGVSRRRIAALTAVNNWEPENYFSRIYSKNLAVEKIRSSFIAYGLNPDLVPDNPQTIRRPEVAHIIDDILAKKNKIMKEVYEQRRKQRESEKESISPLQAILLSKMPQLAAGTQEKTSKEQTEDVTTKPKSKAVKNKKDKPLIQEENKKQSQSSLTREPVCKKPKGSTSEKKIEKKKKAAKPDMSLKDVLDNSLESDDSDDEYIPPPDGYEEDRDCNDSNSYHSASSEEKCKYSPKNYVQILKPNKSERFKNILKRNPHSGAIQKPGKKLNKKKVTASKKGLKIAASKEILKEGIKPQIKKKTKGFKGN